MNQNQQKMKLQLIHTENYLIAVDDAINHPIDCMYRYIYIDNTIMRISSIQRLSGVNLIIYHLPLNNAPVLEGVELLPPSEDEAELAYQKELLTYNQDKNWVGYGKGINGVSKERWKSIYNKAKEDYKYTEEDLRIAIHHAYLCGVEKLKNFEEVEKMLIENTKALQPKLPTSFDTETKQYIYATHN